MSLRPSFPRIPAIRSWFCAFALLALICGAPRATAQVSVLPTAPQAAEDEIARFADPHEILVALRAYQDSRADSDLDRVAASLQIEGSWVARRQKARVWAQRLGRVFDHVAEIDAGAQLEHVSEDRQRWTVASEVDPNFSVTLGFVQTKVGGWLIDIDTVGLIDGWYERTLGLDWIPEAAGKARSLTEAVRAFVPKRLKGGGFLLEPWQWIGILILFLLAFFSERLITLFLRPLIRRASRFEGVNVAPDLLSRFERPFGWLVLGLMFVVGVQLLDLPTDVYTTLRIAVSLFTTVVAVWTCYRLVDIVCWPLQVKAERTENKFDDMLVPLLRRTLKVVVGLVGLVYVVSRITGDVWHIIAGLSIGSLAVGFAAKDSIENLFGTFTVLLDNPFKIGDVVKFADVEGTVEEVGFRSTRIRTAEDSVVTVPNSTFIGNVVDNLGARRARRIAATFGLTYETPPEKIEAFCEGVRELVREHPWTRKEAYHVWLARYSASSLDVDLVCMVETREHATYLRERHRLLLDVLRLAERLKVDFAFPTQTVVQDDPDPQRHADAPPSSEAAIAKGRDTARDLAMVTLAAYKKAPPPPVRFDPKDPDAIGR